MKKLLFTLTIFGLAFSVSAQLNFSTVPDSSMVDFTYSEISEADFVKWKQQDVANVKAGKWVTGEEVMERLQLEENTYCKEICETHFIEIESRDSAFIPSGYDAGLSGIEFSPNGNFFIAYSSYDGPEFGMYYDWRSEFFIFRILPGKGIQALEIAVSTAIGIWSIEDMVWINDNEIALMVYDGQRYDDDNIEGVHYVKCDLRKFTLAEDIEY